MTTPASRLISSSPSALRAGNSTFVHSAPGSDSGRTVICHFTTAHSALKSRSFHRQFLPLAQAGISVRYVSPAPGEGLRDGIHFVPLSQPASGSRALPNHARLLRTLLQQHADIYHFQDPQLLPLGLLFKLCFRKRVIYDAYEDFPSMAANKSSLPRMLRPIAAHLIAAAEAFAARVFDAVTTADPLTMRRLARQGRSRKLVFYNFPNLDFFSAPPVTEKRFDLVYRGGLSERTGTFLLLDALRLLVNDRPSMRLLLLGYTDSPEADRHLHARIAALGLSSNIEIRGRIPHEEMAAALAEARIGVSPLLDIPKFRLNIPVKIFEYWACGQPVIASDLPPSRPFVRNSAAAVLFPPGDTFALARAIANLLEHPARASEMGQCGRAIIEQRLNNAPESRKLLSLCRSLIPASSLAQERKHEYA
ncbi:MAG TPA: glycosyltransferase [Candidatus Acidoferrales bacterium]